MFPDDVQTLARQVIETAAARGLMVATAESCTGGLVAGALTAVAGSSAVVERGFVTYSNAAKIGMLGVDAGLIELHGAVSEPVARAMALGAVSRSADKPVGLVHFAAVGPSGDIHAEHRFGDLGRDAVRLASVRVALGLLLERVRA
jgi:nicotinamide-nucleotide amidase